MPIGAPVIRRMGMPYEQRYQRRIGDVDLHWAEAGQGPPLLLLHGLTDTHRTFRRVVPTLAQHYRVIAPDLPGHGLSGRPDASYSLAWHASVIGALVDGLGLQSFDLVGHSYGGGVAQYLLLTHAERVRRLVLVNTGGLGREVALPLRLLTLPAAERFLQPLLGPVLDLAMAVGGRDIYEGDERKWLAWAQRAPGTGRAMARTARNVIGLRGQHAHFGTHVHKVEALPPIAVFWGDRDPVIPAHHAKSLESVLTGVHHHAFAGLKHHPHLEDPARFTDALMAYLTRDDVERPEFVGAAHGKHRTSWLPMVRVLRRTREKAPREHAAPGLQ